MDQVNKLTEAVTQLTYLHNANKLAARSTADPENSDNSDSGENDEENYRWNKVTIHEMDCSLYNETDLADSFLSHQETSSPSVAATGKLEDHPMMDSVFKEFSESYNQANENSGEPASEEVTTVASVAFKATLSETALKNLLTKVMLPENCEFCFCFFLSFSKKYRYKTPRSSMQYVKNDWQLRSHFYKTTLQFPNILKTNGDHKDEKLEAIQTILDGIKMSGHATQNQSIRKKSYYLI